jgi:hypothetical protein
MSEVVVLWENEEWYCALCFAGHETRLRLYEGARLIADQLAPAGLEAWKQASAWKTAVCQIQNKTQRAESA